MDAGRTQLAKGWGDACRISLSGIAAAKRSKYAPKAPLQLSRPIDSPPSTSKAFKIATSEATERSGPFSFNLRTLIAPYLCFRPGPVPVRVPVRVPVPIPMVNPSVGMGFHGNEDGNSSSTWD